MALSSEQKQQWSTMVNHVRQHRERHPGVSYRWNDDLLLAYDDHLKTCESLLREIQKAGMFDSGQLGLFGIAIDTLLGPAP